MMQIMTTPVDRNAVAVDWRTRGFSCGLWVGPPGQVWSDFVHNTDEVVMVLEGGKVEVAGVIHRPRAGGELLIPASARHTVRNLGTTESSLTEAITTRAAAAAGTAAPAPAA